MDCIFCKIVNGEMPSSKVYEDDDALAFLDVAPATPSKGHVLVIPKKHYANIAEMDEEDLNAMFSVVQKVAFGLMKDAEGVNILQNNGEAAGQLVDHVHVHIVPRFKGDGVGLGKWKMYKYDEGEMEKFQEKIKRLLNES